MGFVHSFSTSFFRPISLFSSVLRHLTSQTFGNMDPALHGLQFAFHEKTFALLNDLQLVVLLRYSFKLLFLMKAFYYFNFVLMMFWFLEGGCFGFVFRFFFGGGGVWLAGFCFVFLFVQFCFFSQNLGMCFSRWS